MRALITLVASIALIGFAAPASAGPWHHHHRHCHWHHHHMVCWR